MFVLADGTMHAHTSQMPVGTYKKGHRHGPGFHVMCVTGHGYSLAWFDGEKDFTRIDWKHGTVFAPPDRMFHQHFNTSPTPSRYLATAFGSLRYPFTDSKRKSLTGGGADGLKQGGVSTSVKQGGDQIEFEDQSPRVHQLYLQATRAAGVAVKMEMFR